MGPIDRRLRIWHRCCILLFHIFLPPIERQKTFPRRKIRLKLCVCPPHHVERASSDSESDSPDSELVPVARLAVDLPVGAVVHRVRVEVAAADEAGEAALVPALITDQFIFNLI